MMFTAFWFLKYKWTAPINSHETNDQRSHFSLNIALNTKLTLSLSDFWPSESWVVKGYLFLWDMCKFQLFGCLTGLKKFSRQRKRYQQNLKINVMYDYTCRILCNSHKSLDLFYYLLDNVSNPSNFRSFIYMFIIVLNVFELLFLL